MTKEEIISVSAAYLRCELMFTHWKEHSDELLELYPGFAYGDTRADDRIVLQKPTIYLILGSALLFVVVDFLREHHFCFPDSIRTDIEELYPKWREFRNCVFHTQKVLVSDREKAFLEHPNCLLLMAKIYQEIAAIVQKELEKIQPL
jgi:hypothetical protein